MAPALEEARALGRARPAGLAAEAHDHLCRLGWRGARPARFDRVGGAARRRPGRPCRRVHQFRRERPRIPAGRWLAHPAGADQPGGAGRDRSGDPPERLGAPAGEPAAPRACGAAPGAARAHRLGDPGAGIRIGLHALPPARRCRLARIWDSADSIRARASTIRPTTTTSTTPTSSIPTSRTGARSPKWPARPSCGSPTPICCRSTSRASPRRPRATSPNSRPCSGTVRPTSATVTVSSGTASLRRRPIRGIRWCPRPSRTCRRPSISPPWKTPPAPSPARPTATERRWAPYPRARWPPRRRPSSTSTSDCARASVSCWIPRGCRTGPGTGTCSMPRVSTRAMP